MAAESSDGLGGRPGERWRNMTDDIWYQLVSSLRKPCAACLRRHAADLAAALGDPVPRTLRVRAARGPARRPGPDRVPVAAAWPRRCRSAARSSWSVRSTG